MQVIDLACSKETKVCDNESIRQIVETIMTKFSVEYQKFDLFVENFTQFLVKTSELSCQTEADPQLSTKLRMLFEIPQTQSLKGGQLDKFSNALENVRRLSVMRKLVWNHGKIESKNGGRRQLLRVKLTLTGVIENLRFVVNQVKESFKLASDDTSSLVSASSLSSNEQNSPRSDNNDAEGSAKNGTAVVRSLRHSTESEHRVSSFNDEPSSHSSRVSTEVVSTDL